MLIANKFNLFWKSLRIKIMIILLSKLKIIIIFKSIKKLLVLINVMALTVWKINSIHWCRIEDYNDGDTRSSLLQLWICYYQPRINNICSGLPTLTHNLCLNYFHVASGMFRVEVNRVTRSNVTWDISLVGVAEEEYNARMYVSFGVCWQQLTSLDNAGAF